MYYNIDWEKTKEKVRWMMKERNYTLKKMASDLYMVDIFGKDKIEDILAFLDD